MRTLLAIAFLFITTHGFSQALELSVKDKTPVSIHGETFMAQNASHDHSLRISKSGNPVYNFRVEKGDQWWLELVNQKSLERSELSHKKFYSKDDLIWQSYSFKIDEAVSDAWQVIGQWHGSKGFKGRSPYIALQINGENLMILRRHIDGKDVRTTKIVLPLVVGQWQDVVIKSKVGVSDGIFNLWIGGKLVVTHHGSLGYLDEPDRGYWKFGIYRSDSEHPTQVQYSNMRIGKASLREKIKAPDPR